jgi:hypothetical protein
MPAMIVTPIDPPGPGPTPALLVVTQADHARLASELLGLLRLPELVDHPRRALLLRAVAEHDNGWWEVDAAPRLAATGSGPLDFRAAPAPLRQEVWKRGVERFAGDSPALAAMVARHALRLLVPRFGGDAEWSRFLTDLQDRHLELLAAAAAELDRPAEELEVELAALDGWLALADQLALAAATGDGALVHRPGWSVAIAVEPESTRLGVAPFPWAGATRFELSSRRLPVRPYASETDLGRALATARWERRPIRLVPLDGRAAR